MYHIASTISLNNFFLMETSEQYIATPPVNFVSVNDKNLELFLAYRISSPLMNAFWCWWREMI